MTKKTFHIFSIIFILSFFILPKFSFAEGAPTITMKDLTDTSVAFLGTNFPQNKEISFNVQNYDSRTPEYTDPQDYMTDDTGIILVQFYGLSPGGHYKYRYVYTGATASGSFYTKGTPIDGNTENDSTIGGITPFDNGGLVPCGTLRSPIYTDTTTGKQMGGDIKNPCEVNGMKYLMDMINKIINYMLFVLALPIAAIMFAYAGFMLILSGGESSKRTKAKEIFMNVLIGLIVAAACWLIVNAILSIVGYDGSWIGFKIGV